MTGDDPFDGVDDSERTIIRPNPAGRIKTVLPQQDSRNQSLDEFLLDRQTDVIDFGVNKLVAGAAGVFDVLLTVSRLPQFDNLGKLRGRIIKELECFSENAQAKGYDTQTIGFSQYLLCATADDLVLQTPWGANSEWASSTLVLTFHNEAYGGERFFQIVDVLLREPGKYIDVLELANICLEFGFHGQFRVGQHSVSSLNQVRNRVLSQIQKSRGPEKHMLSDHWEGLTAEYLAPKSRVPVWIVAAATAVICLGLYAAFLFAINIRSDSAFYKISRVFQGQEVIIQRATVVAESSVKRVDTGVYKRVSGFLQPDIEKNLVTVIDRDADVVILIRNSGMFGSGKASVNKRFSPLLQRVSQALEDEKGRIVVTGHTDNVPIRTLRFPSNWALSEARATAVAVSLTEGLSDSARVVAEGRAETEPVASNKTKEGREKNRRIEIILAKVRPESP